MCRHGGVIGVYDSQVPLRPHVEPLGPLPGFDGPADPLTGPFSEWKKLMADGRRWREAGGGLDSQEFRGRILQARVRRATLPGIGGAARRRDKSERGLRGAGRGGLYYC